MIKQLVLGAVASIALFLSGLAVGNAFTAPVAEDIPEPQSTIPASKIEDQQTGVGGDKEQQNPAIRIGTGAQIIYEYLYEDGIVETVQEDSPYFMLDMTEDLVRETFPSWEIREFSPALVVMRKTVETPSGQYFLIGEHEGFVAVFYQNEINGTSLKEITNTPLSALAAEEQEKIRAGIPVIGQDVLYKLLQDYES